MKKEKIYCVQYWVEENRILKVRAKNKEEAIKKWENDSLSGFISDEIDKHADRGITDVSEYK